MASRVPRIVQNAIVVAVASGVAILAAEAAVRAFGLAQAGGVALVSAASFDSVPGLFEPSQSVVERRVPALAFPVRINTLGYRGADVSAVRRPDAHRILLVGDSFTFGDFVADDETLPAALQRALSGCSRPLEVVNAGVGGSSIDTQEHVVERALRLDPTLVVLTFYENDIGDLSRDFWADLAAARAARARLPLSLAYPVLRHSAILNLVLRTRARFGERGRIDTGTAPGVDTEAVSRLRGRYEATFDRVRRTLTARGVPFVFATYPSHQSVSARVRSAGLAWVEEMAATRGVPTVSLFDPLTQSGLPVERLYLLPLDGHPRAEAYDIAAGALAKVLERLTVRCGGQNGS